MLAAGLSRRLGQPKQLLAYGSSTLLGHVLDTARGSSLDQIVVALGGAADEVRARVDLSAVTAVESPAPEQGCARSIGVGLAAMRDDWTELCCCSATSPASRRRRWPHCAGRGDAPIAIREYDDGPGHRLLFARRLARELAALHGDRGVWTLLDRYADAAARVPVSGPIPRDVDTWDDYEAITARS